jgi:hypothetical protein
MGLHRLSHGADHIECLFDTILSLGDERVSCFVHGLLERGGLHRKRFGLGRVALGKSRGGGEVRLGFRECLRVRDIVLVERRLADDGALSNRGVGYTSALKQGGISGTAAESRIARSIEWTYCNW